MKQQQEERESGEQTLSGIAKTHEKIRNEARGVAITRQVCRFFVTFQPFTNLVSLYFKQKLRSQYVNALEDAKKERV